MKTGAGYRRRKKKEIVVIACDAYELYRVPRFIYINHIFLPVNEKYMYVLYSSL